MSLKKHREGGSLVSSRVAFMDLAAVDQVSKEAKRMGAIQVLFVTEKGLSKVGVARQIRRLLEEEGVQVVPVYGTKSDQNVTSLADGMKSYQIDQCDMPVADTDIDIFLL